MDLRFTSEQETFRKEVQSFIGRVKPRGWEGGEEGGWDGEENIRRTKSIVKRLAESGWLTMHWPQEYGGKGAPHMDQLIYREEMSYHGLPMDQLIYREEMSYHGLPTDVGTSAVSWVGPTLMLYGTEEQKKEYLPPIAAAEQFWCTLYSEPGQGSDLAGLQTRAARDGDDYVINGSKIWNTGAHIADMCWLAARTDPDAPKHRGISLFTVDMKSRGITVRPVINLAGIHSFNQVFFDNVRVPRRDIVGEENRGWYVVAVALDFERSGVGSPASAKRLMEELVRYAKATPQGGGALAQDPLVRNRFADMMVEIEVCRWLCYRIAWMQSQGLVPNREASASKLFGADLTQHLADFAMWLLGAYGQLMPGSKWAQLRGRIARSWLTSFSATIGGGTNEIPRNIIAQRGLGLPRG